MNRYSYRIVSRQNAVATATLVGVLLYIGFGATGMVLARAWWALALLIVGLIVVGWYLMPCVFALRAEVVFGPGGLTCRQGANTWRLAWRDIEKVGRRPGRLLIFPRAGVRPVLGRGAYRASAYLVTLNEEKAPREALYVPVHANQLALVSMALHRYLGPQPDAHSV